MFIHIGGLMAIEELCKMAKDVIGIVAKIPIETGRCVDLSEITLEDMQEYAQQKQPLFDYFEKLNDNQVYELINFMYFGKSKLYGDSLEQNMSWSEFMQNPINVGERKVQESMIAEKIPNLAIYFNKAMGKMTIHDNTGYFH